jgi:hypothetical protein
LCDEQSEPVSTEVFRGNTHDPKTFGAQVKKAGERFGCERMTPLCGVRDRGMIKSGQVEELAQVGFHDITAIAKPEIETLLKAGVLQMQLFSVVRCQVEEEGVRYVLRRNPLRAEEIAGSCAHKRARVERLCQEQNRYLAEHPRAQGGKAEERVRAKIGQLKIELGLEVWSEGRSLKLRVNEAAREEASRLDGCYVIKTDLPESAASQQVL